MNATLTSQNEDLQTLNSQFSVLNTQMKEANRIKDEYIGRFLELCSALIHRGEERHKYFNRLARDRKLEELYAELKSPKAINEGIHIFHQNFDTAFLNIYPDFISEVNRLMMPGNQFEVEEDSTKLTTELRSSHAPCRKTPLRMTSRRLPPIRESLFKGKVSLLHPIAVDGLEVVSHRDDIIAGFAPLLA